MKYLRDEFDSGMVMAADPTNANLPESAVRTTTIYSSWFSQTCRVCKFKFREGDRVRLCPRCGKPYHDDDQYDLRCWRAHFEGGDICTQGGRDRFSEGGGEILRCEYKSPGPSSEEGPQTASGPSEGPAVRGGTPDDALVTQFTAGLETIWKPFGEQRAEKVRPDGPALGRSCPWCRFRIRVGDWVVACPCGCGAYFHQDIFRHLTCWNEWNGVEGNDYCPVTGRSYDGKADESD